MTFCCRFIVDLDCLLPLGWFVLVACFLLIVQLGALILRNFDMLFTDLLGVDVAI